jgi:hypothetical protein
MASGTVYRRETPSGAASWVAHATWQEGRKRRQTKRSFRTKKEAQSSLTELLAAHQAGSSSRGLRGSRTKDAKGRRCAAIGARSTHTSYRVSVMSHCKSFERPISTRCIDRC